MRPRRRNQLACMGILISVAFCGCSAETGAGSLSGGVPASKVAPATWLGIPSAVNNVIEFLHEGTGWLLNKSEVVIKKVGDVDEVDGGLVADYSIAVEFGHESFATTARDVPCDRDGIPTEASVARLRDAVESIKDKMSRLQH